MAQVEKKAIQQKRCPALYTVPLVDNPDHDNEHAEETHQCDLLEFHDGKHQSIIKPAKKAGLPPQDAIYW